MIIDFIMITSIFRACQINLARINLLSIKITRYNKTFLRSYDDRRGVPSGYVNSHLNDSGSAYSGSCKRVKKKGDGRF